MLRAIIFLALLLPCLQLSASNFPRPIALEPAIQFWIKIYTQVSTDQGYVHDDEDLAIVYEVVDLPPGASRAVRNQHIDAATQRVRNALHSLGQGKRHALNDTEVAVLASWPEGTPARTFSLAAQHVRFQTGQADRFKEGLARSGQWKAHIRNVLVEHGLPLELDVLPHVESSFNPAAYSKVAAAGMWQFMPATAREYMRVDHIVDERMDPFIATEGAAKLLKSNYRITGTWPLALTGYNHGAGGMSRAAKAVGTTDIDVIIKKYKGPAFGFASRNFYACFLAALEVDRNPGRYAGLVQIQTPTEYDVVTAQNYISAQALAQQAGISIDELKRHNPALREPVWRGEKYIPQGYPIRLPVARLSQPLANTVASLSSAARISQQKSDKQHRIAAGESLSSISRRYGVSVTSLMAANGLSNHAIQAGKVLVLPGGASGQSFTGGQPQEYVIRSGDSLWSIARRFNVSTDQLVAWNGISSKRPIRPGQTLKIASAG